MMSNSSADPVTSLLIALNSPHKSRHGGAEDAFLARAFTFENDAIIMTIMTVALTVLLELFSLESARKIRSKPGGRLLYAQGLFCNFLNNCVLGPIAYEIVNTYFMAEPQSLTQRTLMVAGILLGHSIGYYCAHRWMHTKRMYWAHRFHHRFNTFVVPSTANAVSVAEYFIAYMLPFVGGSALLHPDRLSLFIAVGIVSLNNLLIHTPWLHDISEKLVPWWGVSTSDHLEHHLRLTTHWAAPTISVDRLLACVVGKPASWGKEFKEA